MLTANATASSTAATGTADTPLPGAATRLHQHTRDASRRLGATSSILAILLAVGILLGMAIDLYYSRLREQQHAETITANMARIMEGHFSAIIGKIDVALQTAVVELEPVLRQGRSQIGEQAVNTRLAQLLATIPESQSLRVAGADGHFRFDASGKLSPVYIGDRDYFLRNRDDAEAGLVISEPIFARVTSNWVITLSRQLRTADGRFLGLVQAAVRADYFDRLYQELSQGDGASLAIRDHQLRLFVRKPDTPELLGKVAPNAGLQRAIEQGENHGHYQNRSQLDGVERLFAFRLLRDYPFIVTTGLATEHIYAEWQRKLLMYVVLATILLVCIFLAERLWRQRYRRAFELAEQMTAQAMSTELALQQTRRRLLSNMSHELRTPLNGILGMTQIMQGGALDTQQRAQLAIINESGQRLLRSVSMVSRYMELDAGEFTPRQQAFAPDELCASLYQRFLPQATAQGLRLCLLPPPPEVTVVQGDAASLSDILAALLDNACKFTPAGSITLSLECLAAQPGAAGQQLLRFSVRDTGIGLPSDAQARLFQPFAPLDDSAARQRDGLGFELALCQRLAEALGGRLGASSPGPGQGSTFWLDITLPLAGVPASQ